MMRATDIIVVIATIGVLTSACSWSGIGKSEWSVDPSFNVNVCVDDPSDMDNPTDKDECVVEVVELSDEEVCENFCSSLGKDFLFTKPSGFCLCMDDTE